MIFYEQSLIVLVLSLHFQPFIDAAGSNSSVSCTLGNSTLYNYFRDGDIILGAVVSLHSFTAPRKYTFTATPEPSPCLGIIFRYYRHILAFIYAVEEINRIPSLLPNITLGFEIFDSCAYENKAIESSLKLLTGAQNAVPNHHCAKRGPLAGIIGHMLSSSTKTMAKLSGVHYLPQVSYGAQDSDISAKSIYPTLFRTVPSEQSQNDGFVQLLKYFGWIWVGIITTDDENDLRWSNEIKNILIKNEICIAYYQIISSRALASLYQAKNVIKSSSANVIFFFDSNIDFVNFMFTFQIYSMPGKVWIFPSTVTLPAQDSYLTIFNGSLAFAIHKGEIPGLKEFLYSTNPLTLPDDIFTALMWKSAFGCLPINATTFTSQLNNIWNCTGQETMKSYENNFDVNNFRLTYAIYRATYAMAYATHDWIYSRNNQQTDVITYLKSNFHASKLNKYLDKVTFKTSSGENFQFENRALAGQYEIMNWFIAPNGTIQYRQIGSYTSFSPPGKQFSINEKLIQWHKIFKEVPRSVCSNNCLPGYRKALQKSQQKCCYDCVLCSEGEISNRTDMENCIKCTEHQWSNERRDKCIPRTIDFLSYEDALGIALSLLAVLLSALTVTILSIFIKHKETPIVKANNRDLSYILLLSLALSFLCSLLFIGRPQTITCFFRQAAFSIIFAIAVSSVLAKTITVVIAFNATKPGSESRKWIKARVSTYLVCICAMGEILICFVWFLCNPPFPEFDTSERSLRMTLQCNEGSSIAFYFLIGYIGILAVFSFIVAFLARKLPNTFNEATHITFSMLVFCSVWLSFFPAYLSTKGKYMVAVEIFAMLASGGGLLCCIFLPKCYIIMIRPELNRKEQLIGKKSIKYNVESN